MSSETASIPSNEGESVTGATSPTDTSSTTSSHQTMINCRYGCVDPLTCSYAHLGCEHCRAARAEAGISVLKPVDRRKASWDTDVSEAQAKAAVRMLIGTLTQGNYYFQGIEDMAAYNVLKKWSEQV